MRCWVESCTDHDDGEADQDGLEFQTLRLRSSLLATMVRVGLDAQTTVDAIGHASILVMGFVTTVTVEAIRSEARKAMETEQTQ